MEFLIKIFLSFFRSSLTASIIILLVIAIIKIFNTKVNIRVKNALWILILIKLLIPVPNQIDTNLFHFINEKYAAFFQSEQAVPSYPVIDNQSPANIVTDFAKEDINNSKDYGYLSAILQIAAYIWITGVLLISLLLLITKCNFKRRLKKRTNHADILISELIDKTRKRLSIKAEIPFVINDQIDSPCISGILKPTIYIPEYILKISNLDQLSHIFLHEFVHYKRKDLLYNFLSILVFILHWYNPLVWLAVKNMRLYRECTCDACVLELLDEEENIEYGMTLLSFSKFYLSRNKYSQFPIYFETNNQVKDRINMIKNFNKGSYKITGKVVLSCIIAASIILSYNIQVKALNTDNILHSTSTAPGQGPGWYQQNYKWHYNGEIERDGVVEERNAAEDWLFDTGSWFYFDKHGDMVNDKTLNIEGKDYVFAKNGICTNKVVTGWNIDCNSKWYYFDENGIMLKNTTVKGSKLDENGALIKPESKYTSDDPNQYPGWYQQDNKWHCKQQGKELISTWLWTGNDKWFYFDKQGILVSNTTLRIGRKDYVFTEKGVCTNRHRGWEDSNGRWLYYDDNGDILTNTTVDGYKIDENGYRVDSDSHDSSDAEDAVEYSGVIQVN